MELLFDENSHNKNGSDYDSDLTDKYDVAVHLSDKLYSDPEFFGDFGEENILEIKDFE